MTIGLVVRDNALHLSGPPLTSRAKRGRAGCCSSRLEGAKGVSDLVGTCFALGAVADARLPLAYLMTSTACPRSARSRSPWSVRSFSLRLIPLSGTPQTRSAPFSAAAAAEAPGSSGCGRPSGFPPAGGPRGAAPAAGAETKLPPGVTWWKGYFLVTRVFVISLPPACFLLCLLPRYFSGLVLCEFEVGGLVAARYGSKIANRYSFARVAGGCIRATTSAIVAGCLGVQSAPAQVGAVLLIGHAGGMGRRATAGALSELGLAGAQQSATAGSLEQPEGLITAPVVVVFAVALGHGVRPGVVFIVAATVGIRLALTRPGRA